MVLMDLLHKGGFIMLLIMSLSVYVVAVILYKIYQFWHMHLLFENKLPAHYLQGSKNHSMDQLTRLTRKGNPVAAVAQAALALSAEKNRANTQTDYITLTGNACLRQIASHQKGLEMVANISPLLGLLGTVIGMVKAFASIEEVGARVDPSILAGGIWEALLTTVAGLSVAIPAIVAHYILENKLEAIRQVMEETVGAILSSGHKR